MCQSRVNWGSWEASTFMDGPIDDVRQAIQHIHWFAQSAQQVCHNGSIKGSQGRLMPSQVASITCVGTWRPCTAKTNTKRTVS
eukprot:4610649-Amphidinium_carterae.1